MSFSQDVKNEICVLPGEGNNFALLCGMIFIMIFFTNSINVVFSLDTVKESPPPDDRTRLPASKV